MYLLPFEVFLVWDRFVDRSKGGSHLKCKSNAIFFKTCRHILWTTWISSVQNKWGITMLVFELFWYNLDMEWQGNPPLSLTKTKWVIICDFISYFMCNVGQHISKTSMATKSMYFREYFCSFSSKSYYFYILGVSHLKWLRNNLSTTSLRQANVGIYMKRYFLHLIFTFYLNTDASVVEFFPVVVFQQKRWSSYEVGVTVDPFI